MILDRERFFKAVDKAEAEIQKTYTALGEPLPLPSMQTLEEAGLLFGLGLSANEVRQRFGLPPLETSPSPEPTEPPRQDSCTGR